MGIEESDLDEFVWVMFQVGEWPWEQIICLLVVLKNVFVEVDESMFQGFESVCEIVFCILGIEKCDLDMVG
jgi:hypothetical protein